LTRSATSILNGSGLSAGCFLRVRDSSRANYSREEKVSGTFSTLGTICLKTIRQPSGYPYRAGKPTGGVLPNQRHAAGSLPVSRPRAKLPRGRPGPASQRVGDTPPLARVRASEQKKGTYWAAPRCHVRVAGSFSDARGNSMAASALALGLLGAGTLHRARQVIVDRADFLQVAIFLCMAMRSSSRANPLRCICGLRHFDLDRLGVALANRMMKSRPLGSRSTVRSVSTRTHSSPAVADRHAFGSAESGLQRNRCSSRWSIGGPSGEVFQRRIVAGFLPHFLRFALVRQDNRRHCARDHSSPEPFFRSSSVIGMLSPQFLQRH